MKHFNSKTEFNQEEVKNQIEELKRGNKTMILATETSSHQAEASYVPYICLNRKYYIILSEIATHYDNIMETKNFQGMILESEQAAVNTFFRKRIIFNFSYEKINQGAEVIECFVSQHGDLVKKVLEMDFHIFELHLRDGKTILGPGQAFRFDENEVVTEQITSK